MVGCATVMARSTTPLAVFEKVLPLEIWQSRLTRFSLTPALKLDESERPLWARRCRYAPKAVILAASRWGKPDAGHRWHQLQHH